MTNQKPSSQQANRRPLSIGLIVLIVGFAIVFLWQNGSQDTDQSPTEQPAAMAPAEATEAPAKEPTAAGAMEAESTEESVPEPARQVSDLPPIAYEDLQPEAHDTIDLIDQDGPYPYDKDGSTFQNREGVLPDEAVGYYAEYTVETPGSSDRGARRIVAGEDGEMYYTDDHYASFREIIR